MKNAAVIKFMLQISKKSRSISKKDAISKNEREKDIQPGRRPRWGR